MDNICGKNIRRLREQCKMTQEELAHYLNLVGWYVTQQEISEIECGKGKIYDTGLKLFCAILHTTVEELYKDTMI